jgi:hypothetical protein
VAPISIYRLYRGNLQEGHRIPRHVSLHYLIQQSYQKSYGYKRTEEELNQQMVEMR